MSLRTDFVLARQQFQLRAKFELPSSGITGISGPSGSGKTSLLRAIAGLEKIDGIIQWQNDNWHSRTIQQRPLGYVFQEPRLFPHLSVQQNLQFAAKHAANPLPLTALSQALGLTELLALRPQQLSGGQAQRAALARALIQRPSLLLLDEPLANLDRAAKRELLDYIIQINRDFATPMLYVSHSADELAQACDQVLLIKRDGNQAQASELVPIQQALIEFSDSDDPISLLHATVVRFDTEFQLCELRVESQPWWLAQAAMPVGMPVRLKVHARDVSISLQANASSSIQNRLQARIQSIAMDGDSPHCTVQLIIGEQQLLARITRRAQAQLQLQTGQQVYAQVKAAALA